MHRCPRILYTRGGTAGGVSSGELIDNPNTDTPPIGRTARTTSGLPRTERSIFRTLRANDIPVLPGSAMRKNRKHVEIPPAGGRLFVAADFPPIHLLELGPPGSGNAIWAHLAAAIHLSEYSPSRTSNPETFGAFQCPARNVP